MKLLFFSLPRSGSAWLAGLLGKPHKYFCEYFNHSGCPICKPDTKHPHRCEFRERRHEDIRELFGSPIYWHGIARKTSDQHIRCVQETWCKSEYNFTKEVFSFSKIQAYQGAYKSAFCLYRNRFLTFPGATEKTNRLYSAIWKSLLFNKESQPKNVQQMLKVEIKNEQDSIYAAHAIASHLLLDNCLKENIPIVKYEELRNHNLPKDFVFPELSEEINKTMSLQIRFGWADSERVYESISKHMTEETREITMNHNCFI